MAHGIVTAFVYSIAISFASSLLGGLLTGMKSLKIAIVVAGLILLLAAVILTHDGLRTEDVVLVPIAILVAVVGMAGGLTGASFGRALSHRLFKKQVN